MEHGFSSSCDFMNYIFNRLSFLLSFQNHLAIITILAVIVVAAVVLVVVLFVVCLLSTNRNYNSDNINRRQHKESSSSSFMLGWASSWCKEYSTVEGGGDSIHDDDDDDHDHDEGIPVDARKPSSTDRTSSETDSLLSHLGPQHPINNNNSLVSDDRYKNTSTSPDHHRHLEPSSIWDHIYWKRPITVLEDILTMGACLSRSGAGQLIENSDGDEKEFHKRFLEDRALGEGEFGVVKLVHDMTVGGPGGSADQSNDNGGNTMACKVLRKGVVFKDNTLYAPLKPEILKGEVDMLRTLNGEHFCMKLTAVYETIRSIYLVTEYCGGGEMQEYVSKQEEDLRTDDVSRIAYQMLDSVNHCAQHNIIHRDIKPENIMFKDTSPGSDLRLIDFGSGTNRVADDNDGIHTTFAGSAFYISPEMFQRTYTQKTDVWSVGVTLYVLVAGYPADVLQKTFNKLQCTNRNLRDLPNLPDDLPDSFYDMLEGLLVYKHKKRKTAGQMLQHEFVQFHKMALNMEQIVLEAQQEATDQALKEAEQNQIPIPGTKPKHRKTQSISLKGSVGRHSLFLDYQKFQRSLTTLLATLLGKEDLKKLASALETKMIQKRQEEGEAGTETTGTSSEKAGGEKEQAASAVVDKSKLDVIKISELKSILEELKQDQVLGMIDKLPGSMGYNTFAYDVSLLKEFVRDEKLTSTRGDAASISSYQQRRRSRRGSGSFGGSLRGSFRRRRMKGGESPRNPALDSSIHSAGSLRGRKGINTSISGGTNLFKEVSANDSKNPRRATSFGVM